jgi:hypothetical protein
MTSLREKSQCVLWFHETHSAVTVQRGTQLQGLQPAIIFQQDGPPPHWARSGRFFKNFTFLERWIGRGVPTKWPPRSSDLTPWIFLLGTCKGHCLF